MKRIIGYKTFDSSEDFEVWQAEHPDLDIYSISPMINEMNFNQDDREDKICTVKPSSIKIFVTYLYSPLTVDSESEAGGMTQ